MPLTILTGFLGAGKTTLLNRILQGDHGLRIAVLVNDFGPINIDTKLIVNVKGDTISLANGCICCTIRGELLESTMDLLSRPRPPEYVIVEASGVSDPAAIAASFLQPLIRPHLRVDAIVTVVDAEHAHEPVDPQLAEAQIAAADIVVLSKTDLVNDRRRAEIGARIREIVPAARILDAVQGDIPLNLLIDLEAPAASHTAAHSHDHDAHSHQDHGERFSTCSYVSARPLAYAKVQKVIKTLPPAVFRAKGIFALADAADRRFILQVVGKRATLAIADGWETRPPRTELIFIGRKGELDSEEITRLFDACVAR